MGESFISLLFITLLLFGTPGPAPLSLLASGVNSGFKSNLPFLTGILFGLCIAMLAVNFGLQQILELYPNSKLILSFICSYYLIYLAYKIYNSDTNNVYSHKIPTFLNGIVINLINPKAYASLFIIFTHFKMSFDSTIISFLATASFILILISIIDSIWLLSGAKLKTLLTSPHQKRCLNSVCSVAILIMATAIIAV